MNNWEEITLFRALQTHLVFLNTNHLIFNRFISVLFKLQHRVKFLAYILQTPFLEGYVVTSINSAMGFVSPTYTCRMYFNWRKT